MMAFSDLTSSLVAYGPQIGWAIASIVLVEMVRDIYHVLSHQLPPLQRLHNWHHRAYKKRLFTHQYRHLPQSAAVQRCA